MACELSNRICYTMELDEKYASVILRRYVENTGDEDGVYCIRNGVKVTYKEVVKNIDENQKNCIKTFNKSLASLLGAETNGKKVNEYLYSNMPIEHNKKGD